MKIPYPYSVFTHSIDVKLGHRTESMEDDLLLNSDGLLNASFYFLLTNKGFIYNI